MATENGQIKMPDRGEAPDPGNNPGPSRNNDSWSGPDGERYRNVPDGFSRGGTDSGRSWPSWDVGGGRGHFL